jgi:superfamily I DNA/RNA helicase
LTELKRKGFKGGSIIVLSPLKREHSVVGAFDNERFLIGDYGGDASPYLALFSTVQSYKGLESEIVILSDIADYSNERLMYVALSRARSKLYVLESVAASKQRKKMILERGI